MQIWTVLRFEHAWPSTKVLVLLVHVKQEVTAGRKCKTLETDAYLIAM